MTFTEIAPWLGQGLDCETYFRSNISIPFIRTKNETIDYLDKDYFIVKDQIFKVSEQLKLERITNQLKLSEIQRKFEKFKQDNLRATLNNKLIPDSLKIHL